MCGQYRHICTVRTYRTVPAGRMGDSGVCLICKRNGSKHYDSLSDISLDWGASGDVDVGIFLNCVIYFFSYYGSFFFKFCMWVESVVMRP